MNAHIPDSGSATQLDAIAYCVWRSIDDITRDDAPRGSALAARLAALNLLWQTYEVLAGNFAAAAAGAIAVTARLEREGAITPTAAGELLRPYESELGELYVHAACEIDRIDAGGDVHVEYVPAAGAD